MSLLRRLALPLALFAIGAVAAGPTGAAPDAQTSGATLEVTRSGIGKVKLGKTYKQLRRQRLVGKIRRGCPLAGPKTRSAALRLPLRGSVDFTTSSRRKARNIMVTRGAAARGVGIGATLEEIQAAFPNAQVDRDTEEIFQLTRVIIPRSDGGRFEYGVDTESDRVTLIGVPGLAFCE